MTRTNFPTKNKKGAGRKTVWDDSFNDRAYFLCYKFGATDMDLAEAFKVSIHTIEGWKRSKPEFLKNVKKGKKLANQNVEKSFYQRCIGYTHPDTHIITNRVKIYENDKKGIPVLLREETQALMIPIEKHYPPDPFSCHKWLTIRDRERWAEVKQIELNAQISSELKLTTDDLQDFTEEELQLMKSVGIKQLTNQLYIGKN